MNTKLQIAKKLQKSRPDKYTAQFKIGMDNGRVCFEGVLTVWNNAGSHCALVAPNVETLENLFEKFSDVPMDRSKVQTVTIIGRKV